MRITRMLLPGIAVMALAVSAATKAKTAVAEENPEGWKLVWSEEFNYDGQADTALGLWKIPGKVQGIAAASLGGGENRRHAADFFFHGAGLPADHHGAGNGEKGAGHTA